MGIITAIWTMIGGIMGCLILCAGMLFVHARRREQSYDERQQIARGRATSLAFFVGMIYTMIVVVWELFAGPIPVETHLLFGFGFIFQAMVMHTYCILADAAMAPRDKPIIVSLMYLAVGAMQLFSFAKLSERQPMSFVGEGAKNWWGFMVGVSFVYIGILNLICHWWRNRE